MSIFRIQNKTSRKEVVPIQIGNQLYQELKSEYFVSISGNQEKIIIDPKKKELNFRNHVLIYQRIWVLGGIESYILLDQGSNYQLIGNYNYSFLIPDGHQKEIVDFCNDQESLYAVSSSHTYLLLEKPVWIENKRRTSYNPYKQWNELSEKKKRDGLIFLPLECYQETHF